MQNDDTIWTCIGPGKGFCSFKVKRKDPPQVFCTNKYNVTGVCSKVTCPLANSNYATVIEDEGVCYLHIKTVERAHSPKKLWEKIKLSKNYAEALQQIDKALEFWPSHQINRCKQRLTRLRQTLIRARKLEMRDEKKEMSVVKKKTEKRERNREAHALRAAKVEESIGTALLARLRKGTYGELYKNKEVEEEEEEELEEGLEADHLSGESEDEEYEVEEEDELEAMMADGKSNFVAAGDDDDNDDESSDEEEGEEIDEEMEDIEDQSDLIAALGGSKAGGDSSRKMPRVEVEYEYEEEAQQKPRMVSVRSHNKGGSR
ncbi:Ran-binding protein, putative [Perkinsus marinus ATCC 50983]|uniref:Protein MAK16 homolog n=1 Tax=Perkinsus marinus (strain ATCC 50983 / TXsc) TaxID=423536 RepID=C5L622_PERM5|nr:Ran-binding protein, putative [Perkinsus marinus ATCC 50983]EER07807.1 Ran-binding protein, putative [Perkinsus marinus ATCC 50983]|eukprot:XP_002775991.1 Ran-binding protein, putative [Perkinsus marinus ATCC 50983]